MVWTLGGSNESVLYYSDIQSPKNVLIANTFLLLSNCCTLLFPNQKLYPIVESSFSRNTFQEAKVTKIEFKILIDFRNKEASTFFQIKLRYYDPGHLSQQTLK